MESAEVYIEKNLVSVIKIEDHDKLIKEVIERLDENSIE